MLRISILPIFALYLLRQLQSIDMHNTHKAIDYGFELHTELVTRQVAVEQRHLIAFIPFSLCGQMYAYETLSQKRS